MTINNDEKEMPTSPDSLLQGLTSLHIAYELYHHVPLFKVGDGDDIERDIPGLHTRNLFLRDKKKRNFLVVLPAEKKIDLKKLESVLQSQRLSFGSPERLWMYLGVRPGSVCPFAIMNDTENHVQIYLDEGMMQADIVNYHPLLNRMTVSLSPKDLIKFIESTGHEAHIVNLDNTQPDKEE